MLSIKAFAALLALSVTTPLSAAPPEMQPIEKFVMENLESTNGSTEVYIGLRCSSLLRIMSVYTGENAMADMSKRFSDASNTFLEIARESQNPKNEAFLIGQTKLMIEAYKARFLEAKARTGNFSDDPVIASDFKFCDSLLKGDP